MSSIIHRKRDIIDNYMDHEEDDNDPYMKCNYNKTTDENVDDKTESQSNEQTSEQTDNTEDTTASDTKERSSQPSESQKETEPNTNEQTNDKDVVDTKEPKPKESSESTNRDNSKTKQSNGEGPKISIEVSDTKAANMSDTSVAATIEQAKQSFIDSLVADVAELEKSNTVRIDNIDVYKPDSSDFASYSTYMLGKFFIPKTVDTTLSMNEFINSATTFKYDAYDSPNMSITHPLSESVIYLKRLSELFDYEFLSSVSAKWKFDELDNKITTFLSKYNELPSTVLEYELIRNFMGKVAIALSTTTERAFREARTPLVNATYRSVITYDIAIMNQLKSETKWFKSWSKYMDAFYGTGADNFVYTHESYSKLNEHLQIAYTNDFLTEIMVANMLKCYFPSVSLNYFYVIKCVYLITRMITVYVHKLEKEEKLKGRSLEDIINDINVICSVGIIIYENKNYIFKQTSHSLPKATNDVNEKTNMYLLNHLFTGGQYYLLKMFERSAPVLGNMVYNKITGKLASKQEGK